MIFNQIKMNCCSTRPILKLKALCPNEVSENQKIKRINIHKYTQQSWSEGHCFFHQKMAKKDSKQLNDQRNKTDLKKNNHETKIKSLAGSLEVKNRTQRTFGQNNENESNKKDEIFINHQNNLDKIYINTSDELTNVKLKKMIMPICEEIMLNAKNNICNTFFRLASNLEDQLNNKISASKINKKLHHIEEKLSDYNLIANSLNKALKGIKTNELNNEKHSAMYSSKISQMESICDKMYGLIQKITNIKHKKDMNNVSESVKNETKNEFIQKKIDEIEKNYALNDSLLLLKSQNELLEIKLNNVELEIEKKLIENKKKYEQICSDKLNQFHELNQSLQLKISQFIIDSKIEISKKLKEIEEKSAKFMNNKIELDQNFSLNNQSEAKLNDFSPSRGSVAFLEEKLINEVNHLKSNHQTIEKEIYDYHKKIEKLFVSPNEKNNTNLNNNIQEINHSKDINKNNHLENK